MMLVGATPPPDTGDPLWYLVGDLVISGLGAAGTIAATGVAVWLGVKATRDQQAQREEQKRTQAEQVAIVRTWERPVPINRPGGGANISVRNDSSQPITDVWLVPEGAERKDVVTKGGDRRQVDFVAPKSGFELYFPGVNRSMLTAVEFNDVVGRTWVRTSDGQTIRVHKEGRPSSLKIESASDRNIVTDITIRSYYDSVPSRLMPGYPMSYFERRPRVHGVRAGRSRIFKQFRRLSKDMKRQARRAERREMWNLWATRLRHVVRARLRRDR
jgi:hypothetical protein